VVLARVDAQLTVLRQKKELERTNAILSQENARNERELELARNIQRSFIPKTAPKLDFCTWDIHYSPLRAIGGDFFDFVTLGPQKVGFFLGDVSGHGIPAALVTSMIKVALPFAHQHPDNPSFFLKQLNHMLIGKISNNFVGAFYGIFDWEHRTLTYALAGQTKPVVYYPDGRIKLLESTGTALGLVKNGQEAKDNTLLLSQGLKFLFHTDGIQEALEGLSPKNHWEDFIYELKNEDGGFSQEVLEKALKDYKEAQKDDITLITMSLK
jgi:sigma-B regulation protein RsbU (phosphoserine phosphatase)